MAEASKKSRDSRAALDRAALAVHWSYGRGHRVIIGIADLVLGLLVRVFPIKPLSDLSQVKKILVLEQGTLGDVIHLTPFLLNLRRRFPNAHIAVLGRPGLKNLLEVQNLSNELIPINLPWTNWLPRWKAYNPFSLLVLKFLRDALRLRQRQFDLAFVSGLGDIRGNIALYLVGARRRVAYGFGGGGVLLTDAVEPDLSRMHRPQLSLRLLEQIGIPMIPWRQLLCLAPEDAEFGREFLARNGIQEGDLVVGIHPGAGAPVKEWGEDRFGELAGKIVKQFGAKAIWFSDPGQPPTKLNGHNKSVIRATLPLRQFLGVVSCCDAFVGNDSGPMHMAAGLGVPVVTIFGPELPEWFAPLGNGHQIVVRKGMWCRPCWRKCRFAEPYCLRLIPVEEVMEAVTKVVGGRARTVKICSADEALRRAEKWRASGEKIVFTNGCFDLLHAGHVHLLQGSRREGDRLVVGLNTDRSVRALKGAPRPIIPEQERAMVLAALECVDAIVLFDEDTPLNLIKSLRPEILAKGGDYTESQVVGAEEVKVWNGRVSLIPVVPGWSSTEVIKKIEFSVSARL